MSLPGLIEIVPPQGGCEARVRVPGSKSITNRALMLAALARGPVTLLGALWSEDTQVMSEALKVLGFQVRVEDDPGETCNRIIHVHGCGGGIPNGGTTANPLELKVGNAGTAARFLSALVCLGQGAYRLVGVPRMHERPQGGLFGALRQLGYEVKADQGGECLPVMILGKGLNGAHGAVCRVDIRQSSQFASALLMAGKAGGWKVTVQGEDAEESPYVAMTTRMMKVFPWDGGVFEVEPDASSGSYFWGARWLLNRGSSGGGITVEGWPVSGWQMDAAFPQVGLRLENGHFEGMPRQLSRVKDLGDSIMTAIVLAPYNREEVVFQDLGRLRLQECERVKALKTELSRCGARVEEVGDTLKVRPAKAGELHGAEVETYGDHRMAMCFALFGLGTPGIRIRNPACVNKTFPNFFQKLAAPAPGGLGVGLLDEKGQQPEFKDLFAG